MSAEHTHADSTPVASMCELVTRVVTPVANEMDDQQRVPRDLLGQLAARGFFGTQISSRYGGSGYDPVSTGMLCEALGRASASMLSLFTVHSMVCVALTRWGTAEQQQRWLPRLACGQAIGALALSEPSAGSDVDSVQTSLTARGDSIVVRGTKTWISFGQIADVFLVVGKLDGRLTAVLIERETTGLSTQAIGGMLGFRAAMLAQVTLNDCVVPAANVVGSRGFGLAQIVGSVLDHGRYCIAWGCAGLAQACVDASLDYAQRRTQFGRPLREHQLVQEMLANMLVDTRAARLLCEAAAQARTERDPQMIGSAAMAKYFAAAAADRAAAAAVQLHGANGCSSGYPVQRYLRDAKVMNIIEGSTQIQQMLIAGDGLQRAAVRGAP